MLTIGFVKCQVSKEADQLAPELAKLKQMGIPTEPEDLRPNPPVPEDQNAAFLYKQIEKLNSEIGKTASKRQRDLISLNTSYAGDMVEFRAAHKTYQPVFALIDKLPSRPYLDHRPDFVQGFNLGFTESSTAKDVAKMLTARLVYWIDQKDYDRALRDIEIQYVIANHLSEEVSLLGAFMSIAISAIADASLDRLLHAIQNNHLMLTKTEAMLERRLKLPNLRRALYGELIFMRNSIKHYDSWRSLATENGQYNEPSSLEKRFDQITIGNPDVQRMFEARTVAMWRQLFARFPENDLDWQAYRRAFQEIEARIQADDSLPNVLNRAIFPTSGDSSIPFAQHAATQRLSLLSVKLLRARAAGLPKDLSKYGTLAIDPMDGKPMRYLANGKDFKVWSVGRDLIDQGGKRRIPGSSSKDFDIVKGFGLGQPAPVTKPVNNNVVGGALSK